MPKDTFYNLDIEKRQKILDAAKKEFSANPLRKSRVSNIIADAKIPRGSFYQYFEDLDDLYYFVVNQFFDEIHEIGNDYSNQTNDLFEFARISFEYDYLGYTEDKRHLFMTNVFQSISSNEEFIIQFNKKRINYITGILSKMDLSNVRFSKEEDLVKMYQMIQDLKRNVIQKTIIDKLSKEQAIVEFQWYLDVLKNGLIKEELHE
ncbi:MAG: TetR family transcriptional regulator [Bacilli bacterium]|nr:TetR family transcriptional regulator [Bacilli bacterium]